MSSRSRTRNRTKSSNSTPRSNRKSYTPNSHVQKQWNIDKNTGTINDWQGSENGSQQSNYTPISSRQRSRSNPMQSIEEDEELEFENSQNKNMNGIDVFDEFNEYCYANIDMFLRDITIERAYENLKNTAAMDEFREILFRNPDREVDPVTVTLRNASKKVITDELFRQANAYDENEVIPKTVTRYQENEINLDDEEEENVSKKIPKSKKQMSKTSSNHTSRTTSRRKSKQSLRGQNNNNNNNSNESLRSSRRKSKRKKNNNNSSSNFGRRKELTDDSLEVLDLKNSSELMKNETAILTKEETLNKSMRRFSYKNKDGQVKYIEVPKIACISLEETHLAVSEAREGYTSGRVLLYCTHGSHLFWSHPTNQNSKHVCKFSRTEKKKKYCKTIGIKCQKCDYSHKICIKLVVDGQIPEIRSVRSVGKKSQRGVNKSNSKRSARKRVRSPRSSDASKFMLNNKNIKNSKRKRTNSMARQTKYKTNKEFDTSSSDNNNDNDDDESSSKDKESSNSDSSSSDEEH